MTETDKDGLLPCPFCGSAPVTTRTGFSGRALYIYCINDNGCPRPKAVGESKEKAVENWNSRYSVAEERLRTQLARVEAAYQDLAALMGCYANAMSAEEILAIAANMVGKLMAMQDQRTMTRERAFEIVAKNIETGNAQAVETTANPR